MKEPAINMFHLTQYSLTFDLFCTDLKAVYSSASSIAMCTFIAGDLQVPQRDAGESYLHLDTSKLTNTEQQSNRRSIENAIGQKN